MRRHLFWQLFPTYLLLVVCALVATTYYHAVSLRRFYQQQTIVNLRTQALLLAPQVATHLEAGRYAEIDALSKTFGRSVGTRITVVLPGGRVIADSFNDPRTMVNHADRKEVRQALAGKVGTQQRYSATLHEEMVYVAVPLTAHGATVGVVRTSLPMFSVVHTLLRVDGQLLFGSVLIAVIAGLITLLVSHRISLPLRTLREGALRFARGDLQHRLPLPDSEELAQLADALNGMAAQLDERIAAILRQRNEQNAILTSMAEGVLAVDMQERIISMNAAAAAMLKLDPTHAIGRFIQEVIRNSALERFVVRVLAGSQPVEEDIGFYDERDRFLHANGAMLNDGVGATIGAVIVLNDVTRLYHLQKMRSDFVANVSHELRTPITSIKGFVETLMDGSLDDRDEAEHFLQVIARQVDRLDAIIEDLLLLSTVEQGIERSRITVEIARVADIVHGASEVCAVKAAARQVEVRSICPDELQFCVNSPLIEQAIINLVDNAIKYSADGSTVTISASGNDREVVIEVADTGCGVADTHLPRLFERFYRVDKARSRKLGGTGLGLAIVKHIAQAHGGSATVTSVIGKGSTFAIHLPMQATEVDGEHITEDEHAEDVLRR